MGHTNRIDCAHEDSHAVVERRGRRLIRFCRSVGRSLKLAILLAYGALELIVKRPATHQQQAEWLHQFCALALRFMGITVRGDGTPPAGGVVISNHLGYLDIVVFAALHRCVFVAKSEIRRWPFMGWMTSMAGTVYVDRGRGGSAVRAARGMKAAADAGIPVVFFPEGTTSNGATVLKFHSGLLMQALETGQPVTAAHLRYRLTQDNGPRISVANDVSYWGDTSFLKHVFRILGLRGIEVDIRFAESPIAFSADIRQRKTLAAEARAAVIELGDLPAAVTVAP
jgi:1-acyl-sn-glycerol-3-phosphate acyltransferase